MLTDDDRFRLTGTRERSAEARLLKAGPLRANLEDGNLRTLTFMGHEVLRGVSFLIRDKDWGTCAADISELAVEEGGDRFSVRYTARFLAPDGAVLTADATIEGRATGHLRFDARLSADRDFETARAGFTVLHPLKGVVGQPVTIEHGDGSLESAHWPHEIEPWQPFMSITAITHGVAPGISAETRFSGDVFEMEDQRNWTDGSFKTYVRPLALPWPYKVKAGETVTQGVTVEIRSDASAREAENGKGPVRIDFEHTEIRLPQIGIGLRPDCLDAERAALGVLGDLAIQHLVAHFDPLAGHGLAALQGHAEIAARSGLPLTLELALPCKAAPLEELQAIAALCNQAGLEPDTLFVSPSVDRQSTPPGSIWPDCPPLEDVYAAARTAFPHTRLGGGMMSYFTELNRKRVPADNLDYISHCTNPIVHAADDLSVMQSFEALADVVASVRAIWPDKSYRIGPSTIAMRQNPYGSATKDNPGLGRIPMANVDPRHNAQFGAAFAAAYAATVAPAGPDLLTLSTLSGSFGLVAGEGEPSPAGTLRPLARIIRELALMAGQKLVRVASDNPQRLLGLATESRLLLANLTPEPLAAALPDGSEIQLGPYDALALDRKTHA